MAKKKEEKKETKEIVYNIPLRRAYDKHKSKKGISAMKIIREFIKRHTKSEDVRISPRINEYVWDRGIPKPPRSIKVKVSIEEGVARADLAA